MSKSRRRTRRRHAAALSRTRRDDDGRLSESLDLGDAGDPRRLLDRILNTPRLAHLVPRLQPEVLHRVIETCGLEDCAELVALATPAQLERVFDLDLWRAAGPGLDERLDADRFGVWLQVLMEYGASVAAAKLVAMNVDLVITAFAEHVLVFDGAALSSRRDGIGCEIGSYTIEARRTDAWDAIVALLLCLDADHHDYFHRVMRGCRSLSNSTPEVDGLDDLLTAREQNALDLAVAREERREKRGYVTPAQARAFLQMARQPLRAHGPAPASNPIARAYFTAVQWSPRADAGERARRPRALVLLNGAQGESSRLARFQAHMQFAWDIDAAAYAMRSDEFGYLANVLAAGCSIQARSFTTQEASDAAAAVCNLGLENWPAEWLADPPERLLVEHDLISVFQVGWAVLHIDVGMYAAERLIQVVADLRNDDWQIQAGLETLRFEMARHWRAGAPWRARDALDVILILDKPAWAALVALIDECPVMHGGIGATLGAAGRAVSASAVEFISENSQIATVHRFMESLPHALGG